MPQVALEDTDSICAEGQFVTFSLGEQVFGVPLAPVQEIIRAPEVARIPMAPQALDGLANLRGRVLPILNLRSIFGLPHRAHDDATRAVVINSGQMLGFLVDQVRSVVQVQPHEVVPAQPFRSLASGDYLEAVIQRQSERSGAQELILVLDLERLVEQQFARLAGGDENNQSARSVLETFADKGLGANADVPTEQRMVSFTVAGQEYGVDIADVREIVQCPTEWTEVPHAAPHVLGLISLRQRLLPLVNLRRLFGLPHTEPDERQRVVVVGLTDGSAIGLVTDAVKEVLTVPPGSTEPVPAALSQGDGMQAFSAICSLDGGSRLVSLLDISALPGIDDLLLNDGTGNAQEAVLARTDLESSMGKDAGTLGGGMTDEDLQVVVFRLDAEEYGVPIMSVQEIVRLPEALTHIPRTPAHAEGIINLRGTVLPVIDQRRLMGLSRADRNDGQRIMVYSDGARRTGFIVDSVAEVIRIPAVCIEHAPELSLEQSKLVKKVAKLDGDKRLIMLVDPDHLINQVSITATAA